MWLCHQKIDPNQETNPTKTINKYSPQQTHPDVFSQNRWTIHLITSVRGQPDHLSHFHCTDVKRSTRRFCCVNTFQSSSKYDVVVVHRTRHLSLLRTRHEGFGLLSYCNCEKPQETPIHLSKECTTMFTWLWEWWKRLEENHINCSEDLTKKTVVDTHEM